MTIDVGQALLFMGTALAPVALLAFSFWRSRKQDRHENYQRRETHIKEMTMMDARLTSVEAALVQHEKGCAEGRKVTEKHFERLEHRIENLHEDLKHDIQELRQAHMTRGN